MPLTLPAATGAAARQRCHGIGPAIRPVCWTEPAAGSLPASAGRGRLVPAAIIPPAEEPDAEYLMVLTTGRQLEHWHTGAMTRRANVLDEIEPEAVASLAPAELRRLGIAASDQVRVTTRRGTIELKARADSAVARARFSSRSATPKPPPTS